MNKIISVLLSMFLCFGNSLIFLHAEEQPDVTEIQEEVTEESDASEAPDEVVVDEGTDNAEVAAEQPEEPVVSSEDEGLQTESDEAEKDSGIVDASEEANESAESDTLLPNPNTEELTETVEENMDNVMLEINGPIEENASAEESAEIQEEEESEDILEAGEMPASVLLGIFFASEEDQSDTLFVSFNGKDFFRLGYVFEDHNKTSSSDNLITDSPSLSGKPEWSGWNVNCLHDPALQYRNGVYWTMSGWSYNPSGNEKVYVPMLACSTDLVHWSFPNSGSETNVKISSAQKPLDKNGEYANTDWDAVAPELFFDDNGRTYIVLSIGYFAQWHGDNAVNDRMSPYIIEVGRLRPGSMTNTSQEERGRQPGLSGYSDAKPINLPDGCNDRIDGHLYKENGKYYFSVKRNGIVNEIWSIDNLDKVGDRNAWKLVCDTVVTGFEGPSLTKFQNRYYMYTDKLAHYPPESSDGKTGIYVASSDNVAKNWSVNEKVNFFTNSHGATVEQRHGSVLTVTDPEQIRKIMNLYRAAGFAAYTTSMSKPFTGTPAPIKHNQFFYEKTAGYWYENGIRQGTFSDPQGVVGDGTIRGREIYDSATNGWYWLDSVYDGAKAVGKEVWMPYIYQDEDTWDDARKVSTAYESDSGMGDCVLDAIRTKKGKWVRYDENGKMLKGWVTIEGELAKLYPKQAGNTYYYDSRTGLMAKGWVTLNGVRYHFDETTGARD